MVSKAADINNQTDKSAQPLTISSKIEAVNNTKKAVSVVWPLLGKLEGRRKSKSKPVVVLQVEKSRAEKAGL